MKKKIWYLMLLLVGGILIGMPQSLVEAAELNFTVKAILPDNQIDKEKTRFDLRMKPDQEQTVEVEVKNTSDKEIEVLMHPATAVTNLNGVIDYPDPSGKVSYDETLKTPFSEIASMAPSVKVGADATVKVPIKLKMPSEPFKGIILGAVRFAEKEADDNEVAEEQKQGMGVKNRFDYLIGFRLSEDDEEVKPDMKLLGVKAGQVSYRNVVNAKLQNPQPTIIDKLKIDAKIYPKNTNVVAYSETRDGMRMAPNSYMDYPISLGTKPFKAGKYRLELTATDGQEVWKFSEEFEITKKEADKYNDQSAIELDKEFNWPLYIGIGVGILLLIFVIIIVLMRHSHKKAMEKSTKSKSKKSKKAVKTDSKSDKNKNREKSSKSKNSASKKRKK